jgi:hypothetical protein
LPTTTAPVKPPIPTKSPVAGSGSEGSGNTRKVDLTPEEQKAAIEEKRIQDNQVAGKNMGTIPYLNKEGKYTTDFSKANMRGLNIDPTTGKLLGIQQKPENLVTAKNSFEGDKLKAKSQSAVDALGGEKKTNEFLPSYISAGATMLGNLGQMLMDKKPKNINFARYQPEDIDLTEQRLAAEREADLGRAVGRTAARNTGMNAGQAMSNIISSESGVSRNLSNALLQSRLEEETTNVGERNKAGQINAQTSMREAMMNRGMQDEWKQRQRDYVSGAIQAIPDAMADINKVKAQSEYLKQLGMSDQNRIEMMKQMFPNYSLEQINGIVKGSIFKQNKSE